MTPLTVLLALLIGLSLGLVGGGGSILTVPALVYAAGLEPRTAVAASLVIVGLTASVGAGLHWRSGTLDPRVVLSFGGLGMVGAAVGALIGRRLPADILMIGFAAVAAVAGVAMLRRRRGAQPQTPVRRGPAVVAATALGVGLLTGVFGVGGGFLIVPALALVVGLEMATAVGTSLGVIAFNCAAGALAASPALGASEASVVAGFTTIAIGGSLLGARTAVRARPEVLGRAFGVLVLLVAVYTGLQSLT